MLAESEKLSLHLVTVLTYPVHRLREVQVEQTHGKRDEIPAEVIDCLLLVVRGYILTEQVSVTWSRKVEPLDLHFDTDQDGCEIHHFRDD